MNFSVPVKFFGATPATVYGCLLTWIVLPQSRITVEASPPARIAQHRDLAAIHGHVVGLREEPPHVRLHTERLEKLPLTSYPHTGWATPFTPTPIRAMRSMATLENVLLRSRRSR